MARRARSRSADGRHDHGVVAAQLEQACGRTGPPPGARARDPCGCCRWRSPAAGGRRRPAPARRGGRRARPGRGRASTGSSSTSWRSSARAGHRGQRRLLRRLPDDRVAADQADGGVPRPHRDREVERGDDGDRPDAGATPPSAGGRAAPRRWSGRRAGGTGPTAKSQMSIISWTSPRPSLRILPASRLTSRPERRPCGSGAPRRSGGPGRPRCGAGTSRQCS